MGFGSILSDRRQGMKLSIEDVHLHTRISTRNLRLLEAEHWNELPEDAHTKGYVLRYARFLGLNGESLWQQALMERGHPGEAPPPIHSRAVFGESGEVRLVITEQPKKEPPAAKPNPLNYTTQLPPRPDTTASMLPAGAMPTRERTPPTEDAPSNVEAEEDAPKRVVITPESISESKEQMKRRKEADRRRKLYHVRRQRMIFTAIFWVLFITLCIYMIWFFNGGFVITRIMELLSNTG